MKKPANKGFCYERVMGFEFALSRAVKRAAKKFDIDASTQIASLRSEANRIEVYARVATAISTTNPYLALVKKEKKVRK
ncbi:MAG: hypothetical protein KGL39_36090 [Patescibacteria group bacterium]|nr:hypothetical protein [Patescibacteria group bacterium]